MIHEKIYTRKDGSQIKIVAGLYVGLKFCRWNLKYYKKKHLYWRPVESDLVTHKKIDETKSELLDIIRL